MYTDDILIENIRSIILKNGLKQRAVAEKAGYTAKSFSNMLTKRKSINAVDVLRIATALGVTPNDLFFNDFNEQV